MGKWSSTGRIYDSVKSIAGQSMLSLDEYGFLIRVRILPLAMTSFTSE